jgi:hypothetical protein
MSIHIDDSELRELRLDLSKAPLRVQFNASSAVRRSAAIVDKGMVQDARGHQGNYFGIPGTSYDTPLEDHVSHEMLAPLEAEIGIEYKGAGMLAHIIVYGSVNNPGGQYDHTAALRRSQPAIDKMLADAAEESVFGRKGKA